MQSTTKDRSKTIEIDAHDDINSICFVEDGKQVWSGGLEGMLRRWRVDDGHEVGEPIPAEQPIWSAALSPDRRRIVCGLWPSVGVWDTETHEKVLDIKDHKDIVWSADVSFDSTKLATAARDRCAFIWSMTTGERLLGPLQNVSAVRFSPNDDRIATVRVDDKLIRIYDGRNGNHLQDIRRCSFKPKFCPQLAWSADGRRIFTVSFSELKCFDASSGSLLTWSRIPGGSDTTNHPPSLVTSPDRKLVAVVAEQSLSLWDASTSQQVGPVIELAGKVCSIALSPNNAYIATGGYGGKVTLRSTRDILPDSHFTVVLPFMDISDVAFESWAQGDLTRTEELLTAEIAHPPDSPRHARALAQRAIIRSRLKQWKVAIDDAKKSIEVQRSLIGQIADAMAHVGEGEHDSAMRAFDLVFTDGLSSEHNLLLLIKAIVSFECGKHDDAISRVNDLIYIAHDKSLYIIVRAQMLLLLAGTSLRSGDYGRAAELLVPAREAIQFKKSPHLTVISMIFGWDFDGLAPTIQQYIQQCIKPVEDIGDAKMESRSPEEAIERYSTALSLNSSNPSRLFVKRSKARAMLMLWEDTLSDADEAIKADPKNPWGYERRHAALHGLQRFDEAVDAVNRMLSLVEKSLDQDTRQLGERYVSPARSEIAINTVVRDVFKICPLVLIDVKSGRLCDGPERMLTFKSESQFKELVSSMILELDDGRILQAVAKYFQYVTFSHVWEGKEPSYQDVKLVNSVWELDSSPLNNKLRKLCEVVRDDGYRWAWSDTCCIDKTISTVLNQSLKMMYKWYEASAATLVFLAGVDSLLAIGSLEDSKWMTRAWTSQELLAPVVVRFYDCNWRPYLGDTRSNHKESPEIMQELTNAIGLTRETITAFNPDNLSVREKLRLASTRNATVEEDVAYSLIGIFKSDIRPDYGEGDAALGHLLEEIVARSGETTVLAWAGKSSSFNSCLPVTLAVYSQMPCASPAIKDAEMNLHIAGLKNSLPPTDAKLIYDRITRLPPARFANRRLYLPCIVFGVKRLSVQENSSGQEKCYRARVPGIGYVEFQTSDVLSSAEPGRFIIVHPWIRDLRDPYDQSTWASALGGDESESDSDPEGSVPTSSSHAVPATTMGSYTRALRLIVRLQQPFQALLLQQQPNGEFKRVAAEHEIVVPGLDRRIDFVRDIRTEIVEIL